MELKDKAKVIGRIQTRRVRETNPGPGWERDPVTGKFVKETDNHNIITQAGIAAMCKWIQYGHAQQGGSIRYIGVGTGYTAPAKSQTALVAETTRHEIDSWDNTNIGSGIMIASHMFLTSEANAALMECGLFQSSTGAPMFSRGLFGSGNIGSISAASPGIVTCSGHGLSDGDKILIEGVTGGMAAGLNNNAYFVDQQNANQFALYSDAGLTAAVTTSGTYTGGGTWKTIIPKTSAETLTVTYSLTFPAE